MKKLITKIKNKFGKTTAEQDEMWEALKAPATQAKQQTFSNPYFDPALFQQYQNMFNANQQQQLNQMAQQQNATLQQQAAYFQQLGNYYQQQQASQYWSQQWLGTQTSQQNNGQQ